MFYQPTPPLPQDPQALLEAVNAVLMPLAKLALAQGVTFASVEEQLKTAFVQAARDANPGGLPHRQVSRISTTTGINRREVTRLVEANSPIARPRRSLAAEVYAHWLTDPVYRDVSGQPSVLPRQGQRPSFETLAREITRDVHPRSLLAEVTRLGYGLWDEASDTVSARPDALVPRGDLPRVLRILGDNVGSHLAGAVANVLGDGKQHFDQAIVATGLSDEALLSVRKLIAAQWRQTFDALVPAIERLIDMDRVDPNAAEPAPPRQRMLIGLYSFNHLEEAAPEQDDALNPPGDS
jgi:hypothetical protein